MVRNNERADEDFEVGAGGEEAPEGVFAPGPAIVRMILGTEINVEATNVPASCGVVFFALKLLEEGPEVEIRTDDYDFIEELIGDGVEFFGYEAEGTFERVRFVYLAVNSGTRLIEDVIEVGVEGKGKSSGLADDLTNDFGWKLHGRVRMRTMGGCWRGEKRFDGDQPR